MPQGRRDVTTEKKETAAISNRDPFNTGSVPTTTVEAITMSTEAEIVTVSTETSLLYLIIA